MSQEMLIQIAIGIPIIGAAVFSYLASSKASKSTYTIELARVNAEAYDRAKEQYESTLEWQSKRITALENEVDRLNARIRQLEDGNEQHLR